MTDEVKALRNELAYAREQRDTTHGQVAEMVRYLDPDSHCPDAWTLRDLIQKERRDRDAAIRERDALKVEFDALREDFHGAMDERDAARAEAEAERRERQAKVSGLVQALKTSGAEVAALRQAKDGAYAERNQVVALLARMALARGWLAGIGQHEGKDWEEDWRTLVFINIPDVGQVSWHFHDSERHLLAGLPEYPTGWDGHSTEEKYRRVNAALATTKGDGTP